MGSHAGRARRGERHVSAEQSRERDPGPDWTGGAGAGRTDGRAVQAASSRQQGPVEHRSRHEERRCRDRVLRPPAGHDRRGSGLAGLERHEVFRAGTAGRRDGPATRVVVHPGMGCGEPAPPARLQGGGRRAAAAAAAACVSQPEEGLHRARDAGGRARNAASDLRLAAAHADRRDYRVPGRAAHHAADGAAAGADPGAAAAAAEGLPGPRALALRRHRALPAVSPGFPAARPALVLPALHPRRIVRLGRRGRVAALLCHSQAGARWRRADDQHPARDGLDRGPGAGRRDDRKRRRQRVTGGDARQCRARQRLSWPRTVRGHQRPLFDPEPAACAAGDDAFPRDHPARGSAARKHQQADRGGRGDRAGSS